MSEKKEKTRLAPPRITGRKVKKIRCNIMLSRWLYEFLTNNNISRSKFLKLASEECLSNYTLDELMNKLYPIPELDKAINLKNKQHE